MSGQDEKSSTHDEKARDSLEAQEIPVVLKGLDASGQALDVSLVLPGITGVHNEDELHTEEARAVKRKLDWRILPLLFSYVPSFTLVDHLET